MTNATLGIIIYFKEERKVYISQVLFRNSLLCAYMGLGDIQIHDNR